MPFNLVVVALMGSGQQRCNYEVSRAGRIEQLNEQIETLEMDVGRARPVAFNDFFGNGSQSGVMGLGDAMRESGKTRAFAF